MQQDKACIISFSEPGFKGLLKRRNPAGEEDSSINAKQL